MARHVDARTRQMGVHLTTHAIHLRHDARRELRVSVARGALAIQREDGQRRLEAVRQIAGRQVRAGDHRVTLIEETIHVRRQRRDLGGIAPGQPSLRPLMDVGEMAANLVDRSPAALHLRCANHHAGQAHDREQVCVAQEREEHRRRLPMAERDVPQNDRPAEQPNHQEDGADHQVRAKRQRPHRS